ncbi:MAG: GAF domain-containing protein [Candidatus Latescibacteria bacterium]|nr:GAF domain-containing protein [Candidatus Latescibacterota bacterium]NIO55458.1 GAF domain-containing protein [Candidatus Latescibacterota bacterium]
MISLRLVELFSFFLIVVISKYFASFDYNSDALLFIFVGAAVFQYYGKGLWEWIGSKRSWARRKVDTAVHWYSSYLDLIVVASLIYLTGTLESPFLILLAVPLFFASYIFSSKQNILYYFCTAIVLVAVLGFLEFRGIIPHHSCYSPQGSAFESGHYYVGSLLVLCAFMGFVLFLSSVFQNRLQLTVERLRKKDKESEDKILELTRLYDISLGINSVITLDTLLKIVAKEATILLSQPWAGIILFNGKQEITNSIFVGLRQSYNPKLNDHLERSGLSEWIRSRNSPVVVEDVKLERVSGGSDAFVQSGMRSFIGCPLTAGNQVFGLMLAGDFLPKRFEDQHLRLIMILSNQLSIAIEKSRLYESLERKINSLEEDVARLEKANSLKSDFVLHVSHELRTPLTSIKAYVETLCNYSNDPNFPQSKQFLEIISKETERLIRIVNGILDVTKIEFGQRSLDRKNVSLDDLVLEAIATMKPALDEKDLQVVKDIPPNLPNIDADEDLMKEVFINLINNAVKYSEKGKKIKITAEEGAVDISASVSDEGIGIPREEIGRIFDKYFRVRSDETMSYEGVGLGLAIVKNIVEQHGGTITVESEENVGSNFIITIPKEHCYNDLLGYIAEVVNARDELHLMLELIIRMIAELLSAKTVSLMLLDKNRSELFIKVSYGLDEWIVEQTRMKIGEGISGKVAKSGVPIFIDNIEENEIYACPNNPQYETTSLISVPLFIGEVVVGVINVNNKTSGMPFTRDDMNLLISFGERISKALERVRTVDDSTALLKDTVQAFRKMLNAQMKTGVIETIVDLAVRVSRKLGLSDKEVRVIQYVASVHDIGMTKVSDEILNKTLNLTNDEIEQIQRHPSTGKELIKPLEFVELVSNIILYHHERMDGLGYPMGLKGDEIPTGARILAVIDAYQSMTVDRVYRKRMPMGAALKELVDNANKQFDPEVVDAFLQVLREEGKLTAHQAQEFREMLRESISN